MAAAVEDAAVVVLVVVVVAAVGVLEVVAVAVPVVGNL